MASTALGEPPSRGQRRVVEGIVVAREELGGALGGVEGDPEAVEAAGAVEEGGLGLDRAGGEQDPVEGEAEADREQGLQKGLVEVPAEAGDLAGGGHLDAEGRVGALEAGERELRRLDPDVVEVQERALRASAGRPIMTRDRGVDEVVLQDLRDEGEAARGAQVALDDHDPVVLGQELDVERAVDVTGLSATFVVIFRMRRMVSR